MFDDILTQANDDLFLHLATPVEIRPYNQLPRTIEAIFDDDFVSVGNDAVMASSTPQITCRTRETQDLRMDDEVIVHGQSYFIRDIQPDATGITVFYLYESSTYPDS